MYWGTDRENIVEDGAKFGTHYNPFVSTVEKYGLEKAKEINKSNGIKGGQATKGVLAKNKVVKSNTKKCKNMRCNNLISDKNTFCSQKCVHEVQKRLDWTAFDFNELLKDKSVLALSKELGISDKAIHKYLKKIGLK